MRSLSRTVRLVALGAAATFAAGLALTGTAAADSGSPSPSGSSSSSKVVFTIGVSDDNDISSANPFIGYTTAEYEVYQMDSRHPVRREGLQRCEGLRPFPAWPPRGRSPPTT